MKMRSNNLKIPLLHQQGMDWIYPIAALGFVLSLYGLYIERTAREGKRFACDIGKNVSCTKAFTSKEGHLVGIPNSILGIVFYPLVAVLELLSRTDLIYPFAFLAAAGSVYLAYISLIRHRNICLVCTAIYAINVVLYIMTM